MKKNGEYWKGPFTLPLLTDKAGSRGGHSNWKGVCEFAAVMTPFFQASHCPLVYQFTLHAPLLCPLFSIFRKCLHFQPCFGQNSSSVDPNVSKFLFPRPLFFKENLLPRPYILKLTWHTSTKKNLSVPPPSHHHQKKSWAPIPRGLGRGELQKKEEIIG